MVRLVATESGERFVWFKDAEFCFRVRKHSESAPRKFRNTAPFSVRGLAIPSEDGHVFDWFNLLDRENVWQRPHVRNRDDLPPESADATVPSSESHQLDLFRQQATRPLSLRVRMQQSRYRLPWGLTHRARAIQYRGETVPLDRPAV